MNNPEYENRVVLFLDILGFKNLVNASVENAEIAAQIHTALHQIHLEYSDQTDSFIGDTQLTFFSDSLFLTQKFHSVDSSDVFYFLNTAAFIMNAFLAYGLFPRGAITHGKCIHEKVQNTDSNARIDTSICYGPAINTAYIAEETKAIWPRIIVDSDVLLKGIHDDKTNRFEDSVKEFGELVKNDGTVFYLDTLVPEYCDENRFIPFIEQVRKHVIKNLNNQTDSHIREKYELFADYFNSKVRELNPTEERVDSIPDLLIRPNRENFNKARRLFEEANKDKVVFNKDNLSSPTKAGQVP